NGTAAHVIAATRRARRAGIRPGLTLPQTRAILPRAIVRGRDPECERAAQEALLDLAERFSPRIEDGGEGVAYIDLSGLERIFGSPVGTACGGLSLDVARTGNGPAQPDGMAPSPTWEHNLAQALVAAAPSTGMLCRIGIASSKLAARIAAELPETPTIVPDGEEGRFLSPLPLFRLAPELEVMATLDRWGIASIGDLARLPEAEVAARLGEAGRDLLYAARGLDPRPLVPSQPPPSFTEGMELEWPLVTLEPFLFVANAALDRMVRRMEDAGYSCRRLELTLRLDPDGHHVRAIDLPAPTRDVKTLLTLTKLDLEANPPGAPVAGFTISGIPDRPRRAQLDLFGPPALAPDKVAATIARLASIVGPERVGSPRTVDGHLPERFARERFDPPPPPAMRRTARPSKGLLGVRVLRPALAVEVHVDDALKPCAIRTIPSSESKEKKLEINGSVRVASGPWRLEDGWWSDNPVVREYWDVEASNGVYRMYRNLEKSEWFVDGVYD
ncbi:MAG TPA: DNA polymerase Y family protein, partial [Thermoanaerobaculia bacterium]